MLQSERHGAHQRIHIQPFRNDRYGLCTGAVEVHETDETFDKLDLTRLSLSAAPVIASANVSAVGSSREWDPRNQLAIYTFNYEGASLDGYDIARQAQCSLDGSDSQEPVETHPNFQNVFKKYKGQKDSEGRFSHFQGTTITIDGNKVFNPLAGMEQFLSIGLIWSRTYLVSTLPIDLLRRVDAIDQPQGSSAMMPPSLGGKRNWLQLAPTAAQRGTVIQIAQRWMASGKNGWNADIYSQKYAMSAPGGGGLTTGSL